MPPTEVQVSIPKTPADVRGPAPGNTMTKAYVQLVGQMAYFWGYAMVNAHNRERHLPVRPRLDYWAAFYRLRRSATTRC